MHLSGNGGSQIFTSGGKIHKDNKFQRYLPIFGLFLYYFDIFKLPSKRNYWAKEYHRIPFHPIFTGNEMSCERFEFLSRNFHCNRTTSDDFLEKENDVTGNEKYQYGIEY